MEHSDDLKPKRADSSKRLTLLSEAEKHALYDVPDFDSFQREEYFAMTAEEHDLIFRRKNLVAQIYCLLQIAYFKAKQAFFRFSLEDIPPEDITFVMQRYFTDIATPPKQQRLPTKEYYIQRNEIVALFGYRLWSDTDQSFFVDKATLLARRDVIPTFILTELLTHLKTKKIVRPGYSTMQMMISDALTTERRRLEQLVDTNLSDVARKYLQKLLVQENTLSELAAIKQDARNFGYKMMVMERHKHTMLEPIYRVAKVLLPKLDISQQNMNYYASLAHYYTIYDLRNLKPGQTHLYLLCYAWQRYRQITDNLVSACEYHIRKFEDETKESSKQQFIAERINRQNELPAPVGRLLLLYVDDAFDDEAAFRTIRKLAFSILPKEIIQATGERLCAKSPSQMMFRWQAIDKISARSKKNLRHLHIVMDFSSTAENSPWLAALNWMKETFFRQQKLEQRPLCEIPDGTIPTRLRTYLLNTDDKGDITGLNGNRYEFWIYHQIHKRLETGELYLDDSVAHRNFPDELVNIEQKSEVLQQMDLPWFRQSLETELDTQLADLQYLWKRFDRKLRQGKLTHLEFDPKTKKIIWHKPKADKDLASQTDFYAKLQARDIADIFRFVNERCNFLSEMTPLQPRYAKSVSDADNLMAVILAQALNHGNLSMAENCDIPYHILNVTHQQYLRLATLKAANDKISNFISELSIFPHYSFGLEGLYGSVDGQKLEAATPTIKARHGKKYFALGKGVVAYTLLVNHIPLQTELISPNDHESYFTFDIWYNNTSNIIPDTITGDMHIINKANFAIHFCFKMQLAPRFTDLQAQLKHLYCGNDITDYKDFLIQPSGRIDISLILSERSAIDQIVATLGLKEMSQNNLIRKLCTLSQHHKTRRAIFELDKLIRSIYTLRYLMDPQLQRDVHRSQNRLESYHQLRTCITQVSGKKQLIGKTDLDIAISNQCGRLIANVVIAYNSMMLSMLLDKYQASGSEKGIALLKKISPVAWQHIHFLGHYAFLNNYNAIDLEAILANANLV
jgi:TnpA family transposase